MLIETIFCLPDVEFIDREKVDTIDFKIRAIDTKTVHGQNATTGLQNIFVFQAILYSSMNF